MISLFRIFCFCLFNFAAGTCEVMAATQGPFTRGPYPQKATSTGVTLVWRTRTPMKPEVRIGMSPKFPQITIKGDQMTTRRAAADGGSAKGAAPLHSAPSGTTQYEVSITGLLPDKKYYYGIHDG